MVSGEGLTNLVRRVDGEAIEFSIEALNHLAGGPVVDNGEAEEEGDL